MKAACANLTPWQASWIEALGAAPDTYAPVTATQPVDSSGSADDTTTSSSSNAGEGERQQQQRVLPAFLPPAGDQLADTVVLNEETILRAWSEYDCAGMRNADSSIAALLTQRE